MSLFAMASHKDAITIVNTCTCNSAAKSLGPIITIAPPCLAACRRCTTCEQKEEPGPRRCAYFCVPTVPALCSLLFTGPHMHLAAKAPGPMQQGHHT